MQSSSFIPFLLVPILGYHLPDNTQNSLVLLHVLFRHGNRTANGPEELYPNDPYVDETYFPFGLGQLTNAGKRREYSIGTNLRSRYGPFLGDLYYPQIVDAVSTDYNRTKMSLQLVLAGLFPPRKEEIWNYGLGALWQPVPYNYIPASKDKVLQGTLCPNYVRLYDENLQSRKEIAERRNYEKVFRFLTENTGKNISFFRDVYNLYFGLSTEEEWGYVLPEWTESVWPNKIVEMAIKEYYVSTATTDLRKLAAGYLLKKIIADTKTKINSENKERKIYLYSAHENNVAALLITLGVFDPPHVPTYGSYITFEVHRYGNDTGIKIVYENYTNLKPQVLKIPGCEQICDFRKFESLLNQYLPDDKSCGERSC